MLSNHPDEIYIQRCVNHLIVILSHPRHCRDQWSLKSLWNAQMPVSWIWLGFTIGFTSTGIKIHTISHHTHNWSLSVSLNNKIYDFSITINYVPFLTFWSCPGLCGGFAGREGCYDTPASGDGKTISIIFRDLNLFNAIITNIIVQNRWMSWKRN